MSSQRHKVYIKGYASNYEIRAEGQIAGRNGAVMPPLHLIPEDVPREGSALPPILTQLLFTPCPIGTVVGQFEQPEWDEAEGPIEYTITKDATDAFDVQGSNIVASRDLAAGSYWLAARSLNAYGLSAENAATFVLEEDLEAPEEPPTEPPEEF